MTEAKLRRLENPTARPDEISDLILDEVGRLPELRIDITDPPSRVVACVGERGELAVQAATADEATRALGRELARAKRAEAASAGRESK